jgi:hypothetical protein
MAKLINLVPSNYTTAKVISKTEMNEELDDMEANLPAQMERFLDRAIKVIKGYNLSRKKEQFVIAKIIDALGMNPSELQQAIQKVKRNKIVKR